MEQQPSAEVDYVKHRPLLFSIAYEILGSVSDAEDAVQDCYLRWRDVDVATVSHPRAYLARMVTRQALMVLRSSRRRESYVGSWLPEPLATGGGDALDRVLTGEAVTTAMLLVFETLTPAQRAVFVLREVFGFSYSEIADAVRKSEAAVRQLNHRARERVHARQRVAIAPVSEAWAAAERLHAAAASGDVQGLMDVMAPDVVFLADGGGSVTTVRTPIRGPKAVARLMRGLFTKGRKMGTLEIDFREYNGMPTIAATIDGKLDNLTSIEVRDNAVTALYCTRNPAKLNRPV